MTQVPERLYRLLPQIIRVQDQLQDGQPLQALYLVLQSAYDRLAADMDRLYDGWFIETCPEALAPYIGDLVGADIAAPVFSRRTAVANTLRWRTRPGMLSTLEQAAAAATGWSASAIDLGADLAATAAMGPSPGRPAVARIPKHGLRARGTGPPKTAKFMHRSGDVTRRGSLADVRNLDLIGLQLSTAVAFPVERAQPGRAGRVLAFHPGGVASPLYIGSDSFAPGDPHAGDSPRRLTAPLLEEMLARRSRSIPFTIRRRTRHGWQAVPSSHLRVGRLDRDPPPPALGGEIAVVDPERGLFAFTAPHQPAPETLQVDYAYGFAAAIGGGPYAPPDDSADDGGDEATAPLTRLRVGRDAPEHQPGWARSLEAALALPRPANADLRIEIVDSAAYAWPAEAVAARAGGAVVVAALPGARPVILNDVHLAGRGSGEAFRLRGLMLLGRLHVSGASLAASDCTLGVGLDEAVVVEASPAPDDMVSLVRCICGPLHSGIRRLRAGACLIDGRAPGKARPVAIGGVGRASSPSLVTLTRCSVLGDLALDDEPGLEDTAVEGVVTTRHGRRPLRAGFVTRRWGDPRYLQLDEDVPAAHEAGARPAGACPSPNRAERLANLHAEMARRLPQGLSYAVMLDP